jgi:endonuclease III
MKIKNSSLAAHKTRALTIIKILRKATKNMPQPMSELIKEKYHNNAFLILISCLLSLRARDAVTYPICIELFKKAKTPQQFVDMPLKDLEKIIYSTGFYKNKARSIQHVSKEIIERFGGKVPADKKDLLSIKGIGIKTANLVLGVAFGIPAICVDTHVHKLSNKLGIVSTKTPAQTERALQQVLPKKYWIEFNKLLVTCGQNMRTCSPAISSYFIKK